MSGVSGTYSPPGDGARRLGALRVLDPRAWRTEIRMALRMSHGRVGGESGAAARLGTSVGTLFKWLREDAELSRIPTASVGRPAEAAEKKGRKEKRRSA